MVIYRIDTYYKTMPGHIKIGSELVLPVADAARHLKELGLRVSEMEEALAVPYEIEFPFAAGAASKDRSLIIEVRVVGTANIGSGGVAVNRTGQLPAELVQSAVMIAKALNLFICGVDFMYDKARETWHFIEINSSPSFGLHLWPHEGEPVDVTGAYVDALLGAYSRDR
jgi:CO dehydrogenase/acetyl-CoA synthase beta subunit